MPDLSSKSAGNVNQQKADPTTVIWIVGAGGLLGSALTRVLNQINTVEVFNPHKVPWLDPEAVSKTFLTDSERFAHQVAHRPWAVIWAAGHASTSTPRTEALKELDALRSLVHAIKQHHPPSNGTFFLTSSAGGVYAGSEDPPFSATSTPKALSPYGELKLAQEELVLQEVADWAHVLIGRISNLYGPGQDLNKLQGLISQLVLSSITKKPLKMFVSLDTLRDFIYTDDAANIISELVTNDKHNHHVNNHHVNIQVIASGQPVSLGYLIHLAEDIARTKIPMAVGAHASASAQARDLRLVPSHANSASKIETTLPAGIKNVYLDILKRRQNA